MITLPPTWNALCAAAQTSVQCLDDFANGQAVADQLIADHIGFKCASTEEFTAMRAMLEAASVYVYQSMISQRRIAIYKLSEPFPSVCGPVQFLELSDQKPDHSQTSGIDHIEVYPVDRDVSRAVALLHARGVELTQSHRPHHITHDTRLSPTFMLRIEQEPLISKIKHAEMI